MEKNLLFLKNCKRKVITRSATWQKWAKKTPDVSPMASSNPFYLQLLNRHIVPQKYRLLYTIKYGTVQPIMKSDILRLRKKTQLSQTEASHR